jgi:hypothetical protein
MLIPDREQNGEDRHSSCEVEIEVGATSRNVTVQPDFDFAMSVSFGPVKAAEDGVLADAKTPCVALVPVSEPAPWTRTFPLWRLRPDSIFVAHLSARSRAPVSGRGKSFDRERRKPASAAARPARASCCRAAVPATGPPATVRLMRFRWGRLSGVRPAPVRRPVPPAAS